MNDREIERRLDRLERMVRVLARIVIKDQNELDAVLKELSAQHQQFSSLSVKVTP